MIFTIFNTEDSDYVDDLEECYIGKYDWHNNERGYIDFIKDNFKIVELEEIEDNSKNVFKGCNYIEHYVLYKVKIEINSLDELLKLHELNDEIIIGKLGNEHYIEIYDDYRE